MEHPEERGREDGPAAGRAGGFTLVEVMVASLLLAVGMMAALAMQYTALNGFINSRDLTNASEIGERIISLMRVESQQWREEGDLTNVVTPYDHQGAGYFKHDSMLGTISDNEWDWQTIFSEPVDPRLSDAGPRRYCVYARGEMIDDPDQAGPGSATGMLRVQIAVVFPSSERSFPSTSNSGPAGSCDGKLASGDDVSDLLNPPLRSSGNPPDWELEGFRAVHMGTVITRRAFLSNSRNRGST
jgi:prepilin-type N-terminal cleavage/methylation domain-containing protein